MKKLLILVCSLILVVGSFIVFQPLCSVNAFDGEADKPFIVYTLDGNYLFEKSDVSLEDIYISKDFRMYEIKQIDFNEKKAYAEFKKQLKKPNVSVNPYPNQVSTTNKRINLYCTHNDESYTPSDGYDSIYGAGGIHDVARELAKNLRNLGIEVTFNETLHIPHDYLAYSRSEPTAKKLLQENPDALFDIHRDGVSRSYYVTNYNGEERCKVRIVVGQANPNKDENLEFALSLISVAEKMYPWLFADIYYAKGHYNQALYNKMLLFEMGTYLAEKELVLKSVAPLANVINTALFNTTVEPETGDMVIGGNTSNNTPTVNDHLNKVSNENKLALNVSIVLTCVLVTVAVVAVTIPLILQEKTKKD